MRTFTGRYRLVASVLFLMSFMTAAAIATSTANAQQGSSSVEIHKRSCPTDYSGNRYYDDCHDDPTQGVSFELDGLRSTTDASGDVYFYDLLPGQFTVTENVPGEFSESIVYCSIGGDPENAASFEYIRGGIELSIPENSDIVCDWYNVPENLKGTPGNESPGNGESPSGSSLLIHVRACPVGNTGDDVFGDCHDLPVEGATMELGNLTTTTGIDGNALFFQLNPLTFNVRMAGEGNFHIDQVICSLEQNIEESVPVTPIDDGIQIDMPENTAVICDWYIIPESSGGTGEGGIVTLHKSECPVGYDATTYFADCHSNPLANVSFDVYGPEGYFRQGETTDADGILALDGIAVGGTVNIRENVPANIGVYVVYCSNEAGQLVPFDYTDTGQIDGIRISVFPDDRVICDWYNIPAA